MHSTLTNFIDLTPAEKEMVLEWRNHPSIRQWMFTQEEITLSDHLCYINSLPDRKDRLYFLVKQHHEAIGVIDFTNIQNDQADIGLYAKPYLRGVGKILMHAIITYGFTELKVHRLISEVFEYNEAAIKLYKKFGFQLKDKRDNILIMELQNANR